MLHYLHDIRNKLTIIGGHTNILSQKYNPEDFLPIKTNIHRINDLVNDAYQTLNNKKTQEKDELSLKEFVKKIDLLAEAFIYAFPIQLINQVSDYCTSNEGSVHFNINLLIQVLENAIDNSLKADSSKLIMRVLEEGKFLVLELLDNGSGISASQSVGAEASVIPHGLGKKIMQENMQQINGKIEWAPRMDGSGMMVRLYFPVHFL